MLMEQETQKIRELDEQYQSELQDWKAQLQPRKQVGLDSQFQELQENLTTTLVFGAGSWNLCEFSCYKVKSVRFSWFWSSDF